MSQELKVCIHHVQILEKKLQRIGATLTDETYFIDTYFCQEPGRVLKIVEKKSGFFLNIFQAIDGKFKVIKDESITNPHQLKSQFSSQFGIRRILKGKRKFFQFQGYTIILNLIENVGDFLIITGENPSKDFVEKKLDIKNPEYITVSFDEIPDKKK